MLTTARHRQASTADHVCGRPPTTSRRRRFATAAAAGALLTLALCPIPAHAADGAAQLQCEPTPANQPCIQHPGPVSTFGQASQPCDESAAAQSGCGPDYGVPGLDGCWYKLTQPTPDTATAIAVGAVETDGVWYVRTCGHGPLRHSTLVRLAVPPADDPSTLAGHGRLTLHLPEPVARVHTGPGLVGWPTWLWLTNGSWRPVTTTGSAGGQTMTVTATPTLAVWQTGDTLAELCTGRGTPWAVGTETTQPSPDCGHLYTAGSGRVTPRITVTVLWTVVASSGQTELHLPPLSTTTTVTATTDPDGGPTELAPTR